jgi:hypothetical protein
MLEDYIEVVSQEYVNELLTKLLKYFNMLSEFSANSFYSFARLFK